jgi:hypothetical protein
MSSPMERIVGEPDAVAALKAMVQEHRDYLKFLLAEAKTNADHTTTFKAADGNHYKLHLDLAADRIEVKRAR